MIYCEIRMEVYFSNKLRKLIKKKNITQKALAELAGIGEPTISRYVNGQGLPGYPILYKLSKALDCSVNEFFPEEFE